MTKKPDISVFDCEAMAAAAMSNCELLSESTAFLKKREDALRDLNELDPTCSGAWPIIMETFSEIDVPKHVVTQRLQLSEKALEDFHFGRAWPDEDDCVELFNDLVRLAEDHVRDHTHTVDHMQQEPPQP